MPFVSGFLHVREAGHPDQGLPPGEGPVDPGYGVGEGHPDQGLPPLSGLRPDNGLPKPPPGVFPPLTPSHPIQPAPPGTPPGTIWPPIGGNHPDQGLPPGRPGRPPRPDQGLPGSPPAPDQGLPPTSPGAPDQGLPRPQVFWVVAGIPGVGWRYVCVDPSLTVDNTLPAPPQPQPKA
jgi:hypothetical protein